MNYSRGEFITIGKQEILAVVRKDCGQKLLVQDEDMLLRIVEKFEVKTVCDGCDFEEMTPENMEYCECCLVNGKTPLESFMW